MLFIPQIAIQIYTVLDKTMLGYILNDMSEVGYYEQSQKIVKMFLMLVSAIGTVMIPRIANLYANNSDKELKNKMNKVFNIVSFIAFPICFGLIAVSEKFVPWFFGEEFLPIVSILQIFSFLIVAIGLNNITGMQYLIPTKKQNVFTVSVTIGAIINFILNLILIPKFKSNGAALSSVIAEFAIFIVQVIYLRKIFNFKMIFLDNIKYFVVSIIMLIVVYGIGIFLEANIYTTIIQTITGGIIYSLALFILKDKIIFEIINMISKVFKRGKTV